jgi:uncharacterized membrane protein (UPF0127 family)
MPIQIANEANGSVVCDQALLAATFFARLVGLLRAHRLEPGDGLLIRPSKGIHTVGMRFSIDAVALDKRLHVLAVRQDLKPLRLAIFPWNTHYVLELPAGQLEHVRVRVGDRFLLSRGDESRARNKSEVLPPRWE